MSGIIFGGMRRFQDDWRTPRRGGGSDSHGASFFTKWQGAISFNSYYHHHGIPFIIQSPTLLLCLLNVINQSVFHPSSCLSSLSSRALQKTSLPSLIFTPTDFPASFFYLLYIHTFRLDISKAASGAPRAKTPLDSFHPKVCAMWADKASKKPGRSQA